MRFDFLKLLLGEFARIVKPAQGYGEGDKNSVALFPGDEITELDKRAGGVANKERFSADVNYLDFQPHDCLLGTGAGGTGRRDGAR